MTVLGDALCAGCHAWSPEASRPRCRCSPSYRHRGSGLGAAGALVRKGLSEPEPGPSYPGAAQVGGGSGDQVPCWCLGSEALGVLPAGDPALAQDRLTGRTAPAEPTELWRLTRKTRHVTVHTPIWPVSLCLLTGPAWCHGRSTSGPPAGPGIRSQSAWTGFGAMLRPCPLEMAPVGRPGPPVGGPNRAPVGGSTQRRCWPCRGAVQCTGNRTAPQKERNAVLFIKEFISLKKMTVV